MRHDDGTYTTAYVVTETTVLDEAGTVAEAADKAATGGLTLTDYDTPGGWWVECWTYDEDGTPVGEVPVDDGTVRRAFAPYTLTDKGVAALG